VAREYVLATLRDVPIVEEGVGGPHVVLNVLSRRSAGIVRALRRHGDESELFGAGP